LLAKTVYEGVKQRMHQLQADVQARDQQIASLQASLEAAALHRDATLKQAQAEQQVWNLCTCPVYAETQGLVQHHLQFWSSTDMGTWLNLMSTCRIDQPAYCSVFSMR